MRVAAVGEGTWNMERDEAREAIRAIQRALDEGVTHIDTAEMYGSGNVERLVGQAIAGRRAEVFLVSKVLPQNASRKGTVVACERSLKRLGTDYLDCYLLHWPGQEPLEDTIFAFEQLVAAGKIRSYGVSNFGSSELSEAVRIAGAGRVACNQVLYHLKERRIEHDVLPFCEKAGIAVVGYSPFGSGDFPSSRSNKGQLLERIAAAHDASVYQVALRFLLRHPSVFVIPKAANVEHVVDNARTADITLSPAELAQLDEAFPLSKPRRSIPPL